MPTFKAAITKTETVTTTFEMEIAALNGAAAIAIIEGNIRLGTYPGRGRFKKDTALGEVQVLLKDSLGRKVQPSAKALEEARKRIPQPAPKKPDAKKIPRHAT